MNLSPLIEKITWKLISKILVFNKLNSLIQKKIQFQKYELPKLGL